MFSFLRGCELTVESSDIVNQPHTETKKTRNNHTQKKQRTWYQRSRSTRTKYQITISNVRKTASQIQTMKKNWRWCDTGGLVALGGASQGLEGPGWCDTGAGGPWVVRRRGLVALGGATQGLGALRLRQWGPWMVRRNWFGCGGLWW